MLVFPLRRRRSIQFLVDPQQGKRLVILRQHPGILHERSPAVRIMILQPSASRCLGGPGLPRLAPHQLRNTRVLVRRSVPYEEFKTVALQGPLVSALSEKDEGVRLGRGRDDTDNIEPGF